MVNRPGGGKEGIALWTAHILTGILMGFVAFILTWLEDEITKWRAHSIQVLITKNDNVLWQAYLLYISSAIILVFTASALTVYLGPGAMGSGVAEVMGLLNGVNYTDAISFRTLFVKCFGTLFAVTGGLCIGKEGPLVHIGANLGVLCCYLPFKTFEYL
jgi:chloride channel 7